jgi:hypothetical protein
LWRSAALIFVDHPIFGGGPGTWVQLKVAANPPGVPNLILPHAHDMYVQAAAEVGIVGLLAGAWVVVAVARRLWAGWRSTDRPISLESAAVLVSLTAFAGQSVVDNLSNLPFVLLLLVVLVGWVDGRLGEQDGQGRLERRTGTLGRWLFSPLPAAVAVVGLVALAPTLVRIDTAALRSSAGDENALRGDWAMALEDYDAARTADPGFTLYELQTASALAQVGRDGDAYKQLVSAVGADQVAINLLGLAALKEELRDVIASDDLRAAIELGYGEPTVALNGGLIADRLGDRAMALDQLANAVAWDPPLASADMWTSSMQSVSKDDVVALARERVGAFDAALIRAYAGDAAGARVELEAMPASATRATYLATVIGLGGDASTALGMLDAVLAANPSDWFAAAMATRTAHRAGDEVAADRYRRWAIAVQGDAAPGVIAEGSVAPAAADDPWPGLPGNYPWAVYLRPDAPYLLLPQLIRIGNG